MQDNLDALVFLVFFIALWVAGMSIVGALLLTDISKGIDSIKDRIKDFNGQD